MGLYSTVDCQEVKDSATETWGLSVITASVILECAAADKNDLIIDLLGTPQPWPHLSTLSYPPVAYEATPIGFSTNSAVSGQTYNWDIFRVAVKYTTAPDKILVSERLEPAADFIKLDHRYFRWASGAPLTDGEAPGLLNRSMALVRNYKGQSSIPTEIVDKIGCVHNAPYVSALLGITFPTETLLLTPNPIDHTVTALTGDAGYDFSVKFMYKRYGWNKFYRPSTNTWESIYNLAGSVVKPYPTADLSAILS